MTITPTDLIEIERKARAYQAEEAANPDAKTCHRPTPELVLRLVEHIRESDRRSQEQLDFVSQIKEGKYEDARKAGIELASELTKERDDLRAKVSNLEKDCDCLGKERIEWQRKNGMLEAKVAELEAEIDHRVIFESNAEARVRELQAIVDRLPKIASGETAEAGMEVFATYSSGVCKMRLYLCAPFDAADLDSCYSTYDAARSAFLESKKEDK